MAKKYTLTELQAYLQRVIALNFPEVLWVTAEVSQAKVTRGHFYLDLVQKRAEVNEIAAQIQAIIWSKNLQRISKSLPLELEELFEIGREVSLLVEVNYHPVYGLKLSVTDVDANYTLGHMELLRQQTIERLKQEGLLELNAHLSLRPVLQRIAVISAANASGYQDFVRHLQQNDFGFYYQITLFEAALQGKNLQEEVVQCLQQIDNNHQDYDCVVIIRGGGSRLDLAGFDLYSVAKAISLARLPVLTGIGHETDSTIADLVAHRFFKTPTAVANFLLDQNYQFQALIDKLALSIDNAVTNTYWEQKEALVRYLAQLKTSVGHLLFSSEQSLLNQQRLTRTHLINRLDKEWTKLQHIQEKMLLLDPASMFKKGYTMTFLDNQPLLSVSEIVKGSVITTVFLDGKTKSTVDNIETR
jgi:exodeoxyribonuclease VII large subunit